MATILIVEDEFLLRLALADALAESGHDVIECGSILEAVAALAGRQDIDAVITDVDLPGGLSGLDLAKLLKRTRPSLPLWVTSGRDVDLADLDNVVAFHAKPCRLANFAREVTEHTLGEHTRERTTSGSRRATLP